MSYPQFPDNPGVEFRQWPACPEYLVGSDGSVWSCKEQGNGRGPIPWHLRKPRVNTHGYFQLSVILPEGKKHVTVHRMVLESFVGLRPDGHQARHLDGNRFNNAVDNLAWGTSADDGRDRVDHGSSCGRKLRPDQVQEIRDLLARRVPVAEISAKFSITRTAVHNINKRRSWSHLK